MEVRHDGRPHLKNARADIKEVIDMICEIEIKNGAQIEKINRLAAKAPYEVWLSSGTVMLDARSLLAIIVPIFTGLILSVEGVVGLLGGVSVSGFAVAVFMSNAGGAWDNAKKYIESGHHGGKGSEQHKAAVIGDTVGDPFKDTSGPSLNILIKLVSTVSIVFSGLIVNFHLL